MDIMDGTQHNDSMPIISMKDCGELTTKILSHKLSDTQAKYVIYNMHLWFEKYTQTVDPDFWPSIKGAKDYLEALIKTAKDYSK